MNEDQLRALIRESVARHLAGTGLAPVASPSSPSPTLLAPLVPGSTGERATSGVTLAPGAVSIASAPGGVAIVAGPGASVTIHISHATFALPTALDGTADGPCQTEPHAGCTSCGFCQSLGY